MMDKVEDSEEKCNKVDLDMVSSYCHCLVDMQDKSLQHMVSVLQNNFKTYGKKHRLTYSSCCNSFNTEYSEKKNGQHKERNPLNVHYLLNLKPLTAIELSEFIGRNGWMHGNSSIVYPGWNLMCLDYDLEKRHGIERIKSKLLQQEEMKEDDFEEETLKKRHIIEQEGSELKKQNRSCKKEHSIKPISNKYFNRDQYHNDAYTRIKKGKISQNKEPKSKIEKDN